MIKQDPQKENIREGKFGQDLELSVFLVSIGMLKYNNIDQWSIPSPQKFVFPQPELSIVTWSDSLRHYDIISLLCRFYSLTSFSLKCKITDNLVWKEFGEKKTKASIGWRISRALNTTAFGHLFPKHNYAQVENQFLCQCWNFVSLTIRVGTNFGKILFESHTFSLKKCIWKCRLENGGQFVLMCHGFILWTLVHLCNVYLLRSFSRYPLQTVHINMHRVSNFTKTD